MEPFEQALTSGLDVLAGMLSSGNLRDKEPPDQWLDRLAQRLGMTEVQLLCAVGFNPQIQGSEGLARLLGMSSFEALESQRNGAFINDVYRHLNIDKVLMLQSAIHTGLRSGAVENESAVEAIVETLMSRLETIEGQIEETINPVLIGSYKLEIRGLYEQRLVNGDFVRTRLTAGYEVLRDLCGELNLMLDSTLVSPAELLGSGGVSPGEKSKLLFSGKVTQEQVKVHLLAPGVSAGERNALEQALADAGG